MAEAQGLRDAAMAMQGHEGHEAEVHRELAISHLSISSVIAAS
jgi:hypothetical protein